MSKLLLAAVVAVPLLSGCAGFVYGNRGVSNGFLYAETKANEGVTQNAVGTKTGQSCSSSILGLVTTGDGSVEAAAKAGGVKRVTAVDNKFSNILGVYATYCVVVTGE